MITPVIPVFGEPRQKDEVSSKLAWALEQDCLKGIFLMSQAKKREETRTLVVVPDCVLCVSWGTLLLAGSDLGVLEEGVEPPQALSRSRK